MLWVPLSQPPSPPALLLRRRVWPKVQLQPASAWREVDGGTAFLPWQNKPLRGQGGVEVTLSPRLEHLAAEPSHLAGEESHAAAGPPLPSLEVLFHGSGLAVYVSAGANVEANASVLLDGVVQVRAFARKRKSVAFHRFDSEKSPLI